MNIELEEVVVQDVSDEALEQAAGDAQGGFGEQAAGDAQHVVVSYTGNPLVCRLRGSWGG